MDSILHIFQDLPAGLLLLHVLTEHQRPAESLKLIDQPGLVSDRTDPHLGRAIRLPGIAQHRQKKLTI